VRKRKLSTPDSKSSGGRHREDDGPTLPYTRAFLVQFSAETDAGLSHAAGRVEHLETGTRSRFSSIEGLRASIATMLARNTAGAEKPRAHQNPERPPREDPDAPCR